MRLFSKLACDPRAASDGVSFAGHPSSLLVDVKKLLFRMAATGYSRIRSRKSTLLPLLGLQRFHDALVKCRMLVA